MSAHNYRCVHQKQIVKKRVNRGVRIVGKLGVRIIRGNTQVHIPRLDTVVGRIRSAVACHALTAIRSGTPEKRHTDKGRKRAENVSVCMYRFFKIMPNKANNAKFWGNGRLSTAARPVYIESSLLYD